MAAELTSAVVGITTPTTLRSAGPLADEVQEVTMERDQVNVFVWPVCKAHQLGGHADGEAGVAVWSCNGAGGHVLAPIGKLARARGERPEEGRPAAKPGPELNHPPWADTNPITRVKWVISLSATGPMLA